MFSWLVTNRQLRTEIREYRREIEELKLEWEEWFDKFRRMYARLSRRVEREVSTQLSDDERPASPPGGNGVSELTSLTERQRKINDDILKRRGRAV